VLPREDPRDAVVLPVRNAVSGFGRTIDTLDDLVALLGRSPSIGTGSVRRIAQLSRLFPGARFTPIRGNLDTRLRKLDSGEHDALVLAAAGLLRLGFASRITFTLPPKACVPAPGQGIVAVEIREEDERTRRAVAAIDDHKASASLTAERSLVETLGGGCQTPIGALASPEGDHDLELVAAVISLDGARAVQAQARGPRIEAAALGRRVADDLVARGASEILAEAQRAPGAVQGSQP
jgi:hydroxymethylbilane synthase